MQSNIINIIQTHKTVFIYFFSAMQEETNDKKIIWLDLKMNQIIEHPQDVAHINRQTNTHSLPEFSKTKRQVHDKKERKTESWLRHTSVKRPLQYDIYI